MGDIDVPWGRLGVFGSALIVLLASEAVAVLLVVVDVLPEFFAYVTSFGMVVLGVDVGRRGRRPSMWTAVALAIAAGLAVLGLGPSGHFGGRGLVEALADLFFWAGLLLPAAYAHALGADREVRAVTSVMSGLALGVGLAFVPGPDLLVARVLTLTIPNLGAVLLVVAHVRGARLPAPVGVAPIPIHPAAVAGLLLLAILWTIGSDFLAELTWFVPPLFLAAAALHRWRSRPGALALLGGAAVLAFLPVWTCTMTDHGLLGGSSSTWTFRRATAEVLVRGSEGTIPGVDSLLTYACPPGSLAAAVAWSLVFVGSATLGPGTLERIRAANNG